MKLDVIVHLDELFDPPDFPAEVLAERIDLVEIENIGGPSCFLISILRKTPDGINDKEYKAFDSFAEANDWLDSLGYDILR